MRGKRAREEVLRWVLWRWSGERLAVLMGREEREGGRKETVGKGGRGNKGGN